MSDEDRPLEDLESFRLRASAWLAQNMSKREGAGWNWIQDEVVRWQRDRDLQRTLYEGGFAGLAPEQVESAVDELLGETAGRT